jgi:uncharacterized damage-inducible protein DinB
MISASNLGELIDYNYWARDCQLEVCGKLAEEQFLRPLGNSFSSLRDTLVHLVGAEWCWLERWCGRPCRRLIAVDEVPTLAAIRERWQRVEADLRGLFAGVRDEELARPLTYVNLRGQTWTYPLGQTVHHVLNHQTYHRGQVTTLLRQLGSAAVAVDFLVYMDQKRG